MAVVVWLFVALVITQSYTACLTSMLTFHKYLEKVWGFKSKNLKSFSSQQEYAEALKSGEIAAGFMNTSHLKLFLAKYCMNFVVTGPSYKVGGQGFGSPIIANVDRALMEVTESGSWEASRIRGENGGTSTCALAIYALDGLKSIHSPRGQLPREHLRIPRHVFVAFQIVDLKMAEKETDMENFEDMKMEIENFEN
ncbi:hypothetical protein AgCh_007466 [Apium graveolens]